MVLNYSDATKRQSILEEVDLIKKRCWDEGNYLMIMKILEFQLKMLNDQSKREVKSIEDMSMEEIEGWIEALEKLEVCG